RTCRNRGAAAPTEPSEPSVPALARSRPRRSDGPPLFLPQPTASTTTMHLRPNLGTLLGSLLLLGVPTGAQQPPAPAPLPAPAQTPPQDPDKPKPTPEQELAELAKEKARLEREIKYVQDRAKNTKHML